MFPVILRVLTIAGTATLAALLTRKYLQKRAEKENAEPARAKLTLVEQPKSASTAPAAKNEAANQSAKTAPAASQAEAAKSAAEASKAAATKAAAEATRAAAEEARAKSEQAKAEADANKAKLESAARAADKAEADAAAKREELQNSGRNSQADRLEKVAKSKEAALAAQRAVAATKKGRQSNTGDFSVPKSGQPELSSPPESAQQAEFAPPATEQKPAPEKTVSPTEEKARVVINSSKQILQTYKHPEGAKVDLSLANFSLDTAERLFAQSRFDEAWEKASSIGLLIGMAEMRSSIEAQLKSLKSNPDKADKVKAIREILNDADRFLSEASQSFVSDDSGKGNYLSQLQSAFQKTMQAQNELMSV